MWTKIALRYRHFDTRTTSSNDRSRCSLAVCLSVGPNGGSPPTAADFRTIQDGPPSTLSGHSGWDMKSRHLQCPDFPEWRAFLAWRRAARTEPGDRRTSGRGGALKMYWTKPGPLSAAEGTLLYPNRRVNGTNLDAMGIESIRGSLTSMSHGEESMIARTLGRTSSKGPVPLPTQRPRRRFGLRVKTSTTECKR